MNSSINVLDSAAIAVEAPRSAIVNMPVKGRQPCRCRPPRLPMHRSFAIVCWACNCGSLQRWIPAVGRLYFQVAFSMDQRPTRNPIVRSIPAKMILPCLCLASAVYAAPLARAQTADTEPAQHEFIIQNFKTESGVKLPQARVVYGTYGELNAAGDNAVLLPSHYMAEMHGYGFVIGPGKALDPNKLFLISTELFGNGRSSSPSNTPEPFHGPRFPVTTIRDNVDAVHRLLIEQLHVSHLRAVIGFSMGAQQAFQWAVSAPDFLDRIVATSGTAKTYGHGIVRLESEIAALTLDPAFKEGNYTEQPEKGIEAFAIVWT